MSQTPYNPINQGPVVVPMESYSGQTQRIMPPPPDNSRRTKVIIAVVILSILYVVILILYFLGMAAVLRSAHEEIHARY